MSSLITDIFKYKDENTPTTDYHQNILNQLQEQLEGDQNTIILDTETDGKNKIVQISYYILNSENNIFSSNDSIISFKLTEA